MDSLYELPRQRLKPEWVRESAKIMNVIRELELELKRMKEKKLSEDFISIKDNQINQLVDYYNAVEKLINDYEMQIAFERINTKINAEIFKNQ